MIDVGLLNFSQSLNMPTDHWGHHLWTTQQLLEATSVYCKRRTCNLSSKALMWLNKRQELEGQVSIKGWLRKGVALNPA